MNRAALFAPYLALLPTVALMDTLPRWMLLLVYLAAAFVALVGLSAVFGTPNVKDVQ